MSPLTQRERSRGEDSSPSLLCLKEEEVWRTMEKGTTGTVVIIRRRTEDRINTEDTMAGKTRNMEDEMFLGNEARGVAGIVTSIKGGVTGIVTSIKGGVTGIVTSIKGGITGIVTSIKGGVASMMTLMRGMVRMVRDTEGGVASEMILMSAKESVATMMILIGITNIEKIIITRRRKLTARRRQILLACKGFWMQEMTSLIPAKEL